MLIEKGKAMWDTVKGKILNIQHFCVDDGPGIRTTVFFKGCPLRCAWCHNPESQSAEYEIMFRGDKCVMCGACGVACKNKAHIFADNVHTINRDICIACGECADSCPYDVIDKVGKDVSVEDIMPELTAEKIFYRRSGGGVTLSGGEPLMQPSFALELLKACKEENLHTCVETCGFCSRDVLTEIDQYTDLFLFDYKITDEELHKQYTGVSNSVIMENLKVLSQMGNEIILRCPIIPDVNTFTAHYDAIANIANENKGILQIHLEPYHPLGIEKSKALGRSSVYNRKEFLDKAEANKICEYIKSKTSVPVMVN